MIRTFTQQHIFLILFSLLALSNTISGQGFEPISKKGKLNLGAEGGIQFTNIDYTRTFHQPSSKIGFTAGLFGEYYISNTFKLKLGAYFDQRAFELYGDRIFADTSETYYSNSYNLYQVDYKLNYLTIPVGIAFERGSEKFKIILQFNFYYSIYLNASMKGIEQYYFDPADGFDLSGTILNQGLNEFQISGASEGISVTNISTSTENKYSVEEFNTSDYGLNFLLGGQYNFTPKVGVILSLGFSYSLGKLLEDPQYDDKWRQITRFNLGFVYMIN